MASTDTSGEPSGREAHRSSFLVPGRSVSVVLCWQVAITAASALIAAYVAGVHGALSATLGGAISVVAGLVFVATAGKRKVQSAEAVLVGALRAEGAKIAATVALLWLVLSLYAQIVTVAFFAAFVMTVIVFSMALFVHDA